MGDFFASLLYPLEWVVAWIMVTAHSGLEAIGFDPAGGPAWVLSIVGARAGHPHGADPALRPPDQVVATDADHPAGAEEGAGQVQGQVGPGVAGGDDQGDDGALQDLKTNPFASCLPILLQMPIFFALFRVLNGIRSGDEDIGPFTRTSSSRRSRRAIFGSELSATFLDPTGGWTYLVAAILVVVMSASQFYVQQMLMTKNMTQAALDSPFFKQQKMLLYILPVVFAVSGVGFPIGVLLYWCVTNLYSAVQQTIVIRNLPAPGSPAEKEYEARRLGPRSGSRPARAARSTRSSASRSPWRPRPPTRSSGRSPSASPRASGVPAPSDPPSPVRGPVPRSGRTSRGGTDDDAVARDGPPPPGAT